jgi:hypothetical protein
MKESTRTLAMEWWTGLDRVAKYKFSCDNLPMELGIPEIMEFYLKTLA